MLLTSGSRLGPYEIVGELGAGGMGQVYRARDTRLDRPVAIKVLTAAQDARLEERERFEREARTISNLSHAHICTLFDVGQHEGTDFLVMEFLEGETLESRLSRGPMQPDQLLKVAIEIADALDNAHRHGVIHRDLKPANVMLTKSGAKLMDFCLAKLHTGMAPTVGVLTEMATADAKKLTAEGMIVGTFQYMAPEQLEGGEVSARSDIFALGALIYEMATGKPAFTGKTRASLIAAVLSSDPPPISSLRPMTPPALDNLVRTCLAKEPEERWQTVHDVKLQLQWIAAGGSKAGVPAPVAARRRIKERVVQGLAAVALVFAVAAAVAYWNAQQRASRVLRAQLLPPEKVQFNFAGDNSGAPVLSPDGNYLVFSGIVEGRSALYLRPLNSPKAQLIQGTEGATFPFWAPDSQNIGFFNGGKLLRVNVLGGPVLTVADAPGGRGGAWNRDGVIVFTPNFRGGISRVAATGGTPEPVTNPDNRTATTHRWPVFLPDGKHFLYLAANHNSPGSPDTGIFCASLNGKENRFLIHTLASAVYVSGHLLYLVENRLVAQSISESGELSGQPFPLADPVMQDGGVWRVIATASDSGTLLYQPGMPAAGNHRLSWFDPTGKRLGTLGEPDNYFQVQLSPDGKKLAADVGDPASAIWIFDLQRGTKTRLTFEPGVHVPFAWSPDGKRLAYSAPGADGVVRVRVKNSDGSGQSQSPWADSANFAVTSWSPDSRYLLAQHPTVATRNDIYLLTWAGDGKPQPYLATPAAEALGQFSPDGKWIAYVSDESGHYEIYVAPFPATGAKWQISNVREASSPRWRHDGKELFYRGESDSGFYAVEVDGSRPNFEIGRTQFLFRATMNGSGYLWDVTPDGKRFIVNEASAENSQPLELILNWTAELKKK